MQEMSIGQESSPIDEIISRVDGYIGDPSSVTPETLNELKAQLMDLKSYLDGEESSEPQMGMSEEVGGMR